MSPRPPPPPFRTISYLISSTHLLPQLPYSVPCPNSPPPPSFSPTRTPLSLCLLSCWQLTSLLQLPPRANLTRPQQSSPLLARSHPACSSLPVCARSSSHLGRSRHGLRPSTPAHDTSPPRSKGRRSRDGGNNKQG